MIPSKLLDELSLTSPLESGWVFLVSSGRSRLLFPRISSSALIPGQPNCLPGRREDCVVDSPNVIHKFPLVVDVDDAVLVSLPPETVLLAP